MKFVIICRHILGDKKDKIKKKCEYKKWLIVKGVKIGLFFLKVR